MVSLSMYWHKQFYNFAFYMILCSGKLCIPSMYELSYMITLITFLGAVTQPYSTVHQAIAENSRAYFIARMPFSFDYLRINKN